MSQAELICDGDVCELCGIELKNGAGFPQKCKGCGGDGEAYD